MAFGVDTSQLPTIPGLSTITASAPISGISNKSKEIMTSLADNRSALFANPMVNAINSVDSTLSQLNGQLESIASGEILNNSISQGQANTFLASSSIADVQTALADLFSHTDRLSGVLKGNGINAPGLEEILSLGKQMNDLTNLLNAGSGCLSMIGGATGLFSQADMAIQASTIADITNKVSRGVATIADITTALSGVSTFVQGIIDKDSQFLQNCVTQLQSAALAMGLEYVFQDPCAKFLLEQVNNRNPGGILSKLLPQ